MARGRMLRTQISICEQLADVSLSAALLFTWAITHADDFGRLPGSARRIRALVVPLRRDYCDDMIEANLVELADAKLINRYCIESEWFIEFPTWDSHQSGLNKRTKSKYPDPPPAPCSSQENPGNSGNFCPEQNRNKQNLTEHKELNDNPQKCGAIVNFIIWPAAWTMDTVAACQQAVAELSSETAQQIADVAAAASGRRERPVTNVVKYVIALARGAMKGDFDPSPGREIAKMRSRALAERRAMESAAAEDAAAAARTPEQIAVSRDAARAALAAAKKITS